MLIYDGHGKISSIHESFSLKSYRIFKNVSDIQRGTYTQTISVPCLLLYLEYCVQVWSPYLLKYIKLIEGVQRRATRMVPELRELSYEDRLKKLNLTTLEERRVRGDMIETYKIISGKENINPDKFFQLRPDWEGPRARDKKIFKKYARKEVRRCSFALRVTNGWNGHTNDIVNAHKTSEFLAR